MPLSRDELVRACDRAAVAELVYTDDHGGVRVTAVTPLVFENAPAVALAYGDRALVRDLAACGEVALALSDSRLAYRGWQPLGMSGPVRVDEDPKGKQFQAQLLDQELRKHPPSRALLDTPVLRREHWWYVPRWIVRFTPARARALGRRTGPDDGVLAFAAGGSVDVDTVAVQDWAADAVVLGSLADHDIERVRGPAAVFTHDFSIPDLERRVEYAVQGELRGGRLHAATRSGTRALPGPLTLRARLRCLRELERACRRELRRTS